MDVKLKLEHVVWLKRREELNPSLDVARSNCIRLSSNWYPPITIEVLGVGTLFHVSDHVSCALNTVWIDVVVPKAFYSDHICTLQITPGPPERATSSS